MLSLSMTPGLPFYDIYLMGGGKSKAIYGLIWRNFLASDNGIIVLVNFQKCYLTYGLFLGWEILPF